MSQPAKYPLIMPLLHWLMAVLIFGMIAAGWYMTPFDEEKAEFL